MKLFLCWSGARSHDVAAAFRDFLLQLNDELSLPVPLQFAPPFFSENIEKGLPWFQAVEHELASTDAALLSITPENADSPWMHYEAGAIANQLSISTTQSKTTGTLKARLFTYLFGMEARDLKGPLNAYQSTAATFTDTRALIRQLLGVDTIKGTPDDDPRPETRLKWNEDAFRRCWNTLALRLQHSRSQPFCEAVTGLEDKFRRLTFEEAVDFCHRQAWIDRIKGCHEVLTDLDGHLERVKDRCRPSEAELYQQLLAALDGYEMTMQAYLVKERRFELGKQGLLSMEEDVRWVCENRRRIVKDAVAALLDPGRAPVFDESPAFDKLETFAEKKNAIHRKKAAIRIWIAQHQAVGDPEGLSPQEKYPADAPGKVPDIQDWQTPPTLPAAAEFGRARMTDWDFDRIVYYATHQECLCQGFQPDGANQKYGILTGSAVEENVCSWLEDEVQKIGASPTTRESRLPLYYALSVLKHLVDQGVRDRNGARLEFDASTKRRVISVLNDIVKIEGGVKTQVVRTAEMLLGSLTDPATDAAA